MKISRAEATTFAILLAIIAALSLYLVLRGGDRVRYELPKLARVSASEIDGLEVTLPGADTGLEVLRLKRSGTRWTIEPQGYRADASIVEEITRELASLKITDLVSMSAAGGARYGLDANSRVTVKASRGGDVVRALHVGNRAPTDHHSYAACSMTHASITPRGTSKASLPAASRNFAIARYWNSAAATSCPSKSGRTRGPP